MYFIPDVLSFCIASVFIFITISCSGLVTLSTQLWREVSLLYFYTSTTHIVPFLSTGLESSADTLPLGGSDTHYNSFLKYTKNNDSLNLNSVNLLANFSSAKFCNFMKPVFPLFPALTVLTLLINKVAKKRIVNIFASNFEIPLLICY